MFLAHSFIGGAAPLLAYQIGTFTLVFIGLGVVLTGYAIYWLIFKVGKED